APARLGRRGARADDGSDELGLPASGESAPAFPCSGASTGFARARAVSQPIPPRPPVVPRGGGGLSAVGVCQDRARYLSRFSSCRLKRFEAFLNPWVDPLGKGFQIIQSYIAVGTGGIDGVGLMEGKQKLFYLPEPHTDFIFAVISEELGFIGALFVLGLFGV